MPSTRHSAEAVHDLLTREGFAHGDISAVFDSMVNAGLELDQPDDGYVLTDAEVDLLREQLSDQ